MSMKHSCASAKGIAKRLTNGETRYQSRMFQLVPILTSGDADAEDLVQDTFVRAYRAVGQFPATARSARAAPDSL